MSFCLVSIVILPQNSIPSNFQMNLKTEVARGAIWVFMDQFGVQMVTFIVNLVLAHLLMPADFGTIALFNIMISISSVLVNGGLSSSLVRTQSIDNRDLSTVFWFNIGITLLLYMIIFSLAPLVANFYHLPVLTAIIRVYSIILIIDSFVHVQAALFDKKLDFKTTFKVRLPSCIVGGIAGVIFAFAGYGVWSLVFSALIQNLLYTLQYWFYSDWRPTFEFDREKFKYHFGFGSRLTLSALLNVMFDNIYTIVIGKQFSETTLGYYNRAESFKNLPVNNVSTALNKVTYPLFVRFSDDDQKLRHAYKRVLKQVIFVIAPLICMMIIVADPMIRFLLGEKWIPVIPFFQIMALGAFFQPIHNYNLNILQVKGRSDLYLQLEVIKKILIIITVMIGLKFGIFGLIWGQVVISVFSLFINTYYSAKFLKYTMMEQLVDLLPSILIACCIAYLVWLGDSFLLTWGSEWVRAIIITVSYLLLFFSVNYLIRADELLSIKEMLKGQWKIKENTVEN